MPEIHKCFHGPHEISIDGPEKGSSYSIILQTSGFAGQTDKWSVQLRDPTGTIFYLSVGGDDQGNLTHVDELSFFLPVDGRIQCIHYTLSEEEPGIATLPDNPTLKQVAQTAGFPERVDCFGTAMKYYDDTPPSYEEVRQSFLVQAPAQATTPVSS
ncbi:MAG: hypothetical protein WC489_01260 [Patescibacteria group bacterium]